MIDRYHLRYFLAVIDTGNFSKAAARCNVSQPTLSVGIAKLEKTLGRTLFNRTNRRVALTDAGAQLATHARQIEAGFTQAERTIAGLADTFMLRIGILVTTPPAWIEALAAGRADDAGRTIEIVEGRAPELRERLARGRIDAALTILAPGDVAGQEPLLTEDYTLAMSVRHRLAGRATIRAGELADEPMIVRRQCELLQETSRFFTARGVRPPFSARTMHDERALSSVRAGLGLAVIPRSLRRPGIATPRLEEFGFSRSIGLVYGRGVDAAAMRATPPLRALAEAVERSGWPDEADRG